MIDLNKCRLICKEILEERESQDSKWGHQRHPREFWITILGEEFGEACKAVLEVNDNDYRKELIQIAAVAIAMIESFDYVELLKSGGLRETI